MKGLRKEFTHLKPAASPLPADADHAEKNEKID
jgi:hypothetical protein